MHGSLWHGTQPKWGRSAVIPCTDEGVKSSSGTKDGVLASMASAGLSRGVYIEQLLFNEMWPRF